MKADDHIREAIAEITRQGITSSREQSEILERDYGIEIAPHILAEYKYREQRGEWSEEVK